MSFVFGYGGSINDIKTGIDKKTENIVTTNPAPSNVGNVPANVGFKIDNANTPVNVKKPTSLSTNTGSIIGTNNSTPVNNGTEGYFDQGGSNDLPPTPTAEFMFEFQGGTDDVVAHFAKIIIKVDEDVLNTITQVIAGNWSGAVKSAKISLPFNHAENLTESMTVTYNRLTDSSLLTAAINKFGQSFGDITNAIARRMKVQYDPSGLNKKLSIPFLVYINNRTTLEDLKKCISFLEALLYPVGPTLQLPPPIAVSIGKLYSSFIGNLAGVSVRYDSAWTTDSESPAFLDDQAYPMFAYGTLDFINLELYDWSSVVENLSLSKDTRILFGEVLNSNSAIGETFSGEVGNSGPPTTETFPKSDNKKDDTPSIQPKPESSKKEPGVLLSQAVKDNKIGSEIDGTIGSNVNSLGLLINPEVGDFDIGNSNIGYRVHPSIGSGMKGGLAGNNISYGGLSKEDMNEEIKENIRDINTRSNISVSKPSIKENNDINKIIGGFD